MRFTELDNYNEAFCLTQLNLNSMLAHLILACLFIAPLFSPFLSYFSTLVRMQVRTVRF